MSSTRLILMTGLVGILLGMLVFTGSFKFSVIFDGFSGLVLCMTLILVRVIYMTQGHNATTKLGDREELDVVYTQHFLVQFRWIYSPSSVTAWSS